MSLFFKSCGSKSRGHALDGEEYIKKGDNLVSWKMPKVDTRKVYKRKPFTLFSDPFIQTIESKCSFNNKGGYMRLINYYPFLYIKEKFCNQLNVGMVQIGVKTLTRKIPSTASIVLCLRDNRIERVEDSVLGMVEARLSDGPFYFIVFPNITLPLSDSFVFDMLTLNVLINGLEELPPGSEPIVLTCKTCYKLDEDSFELEALIESPTGKTVFYQTQIESRNDVIQKETKWDQVQLPPNWPPRVKRKTAKIIEQEDGTVRITFQDE